MLKEVSKPMLLAVIDHDIPHPVTNATSPDYRAAWLAFNDTTRKVFVEVEADSPAGLQKFQKDYRGHVETRETHELTGNVADWRSLVGEREAGDDPTDPMKHVKRRDRMLARADAERRAKLGKPKQLPVA
jgi:hypothetical protein